MLCDNCKSNMASYHKSVNINGQGYETHLCSECAKLFNEPSLFDFDEFGLFDLPILSKFMLEEQKRCNNCKSTFSDFLKRGKLGCKDCYATFEEEIRDMLENMESPIDLNLDEFTDISENNELMQLEAQLQQAISEERYEDAGELKKKINLLKNKGDN